MFVLLLHLHFEYYIQKPLHYRLLSRVCIISFSHYGLDKGAERKRLKLADENNECAWRRYLWNEIKERKFNKEKGKIVQVKSHG